MRTEVTKRPWMLFLMFAIASHAIAGSRITTNFNRDWLMHVGEVTASDPEYNDRQWTEVTLPLAFNGHEAFAKDITALTTGIAWYRKHFIMSDSDVRKRKVFLEFEGFRQGADVWVNGHLAGQHDNGVMACGLDITELVHKGQNVVAVRTDNSWTYLNRQYGSRLQWNDRNFNANYGGLPKNVRLHITDRLYQTLPLYSNLGTTGVYIYAKDFDIKGSSATIHAESQVRNETQQAVTVGLHTRVLDLEGREVASFEGQRQRIEAGATMVLKAHQRIKDLHFWSWGFGYLYTVETALSVSDGSQTDVVRTRTGFRSTRFAEGKIWLNDRVMMIHGYAQRTSNEWPGVGLSVPAWLSDYSNALQVKSGGNLVRWMHVTPWRQDVESCDRVGLPQAMPAGDSEKDVEGARWNMRWELMRDAIIYNRNSPSILFYECGNKGISEAHMIQMKALRDEYDPHGGRAIGCREMLGSSTAEYGGEMLYINKSAGKPVWAMEYCRDEGLRKHWDQWSYPYHRNGQGPRHKGAYSIAYNWNMDGFAQEMIRRWYEYWLERPGTGTRVSSGGVKIVFSDTNTHHRGEANYRMSGVTDAMRIPKDAFYVHQVMWDGWVTPERAHTYIIGHWNYEAGVKKPVYVASNAESVELQLNGRSLGTGKRSYHFLFTFDNVEFEVGKLTAIGRDSEGKEVSRHSLETAGEAVALRMHAIQNPEGFEADGSDMALIEVEVVDAQGRRCPLDNRMVNFTLNGDGTWIGGLANRTWNADDPVMARGLSDNYVGKASLPVECGVNRVLVRSTTKAGSISVKAMADGITSATLTLKTQEARQTTQLAANTLMPSLLRGETPSTPSYTESFSTLVPKKVKAGSNNHRAALSIDDNEETEWSSDGKAGNAWITYTFERQRTVREVVLKLSGWRSKCYPLAVYAEGEKVWEGITPATLGYVHIQINKPRKSKELTIRMVAPVTDSSAFRQVTELAGGAANDSAQFQDTGETVCLSIIEAEMRGTL
ncbi:MAG: DUF4982 domain-containing protein [Bacteroidales bacterium]|nr:DUF4982 domain-containing protein [Bacteroidales bacterium]